jgi:hypothetical protein
MGIGKSLVDWTARYLARFLATRVATPVLVTGTFALAAVGAATITPIHQRVPPTYRNSRCQMQEYHGYGVIACDMPVSLVASHRIACYWWYPYGDSDGVYVCDFPQL